MEAGAGAASPGAVLCGHLRIAGRKNRATGNSAACHGAARNSATDRCCPAGGDSATHDGARGHGLTGGCAAFGRRGDQDAASGVVA
jgi:hypothetical protein